MWPFLFLLFLFFCFSLLFSLARACSLASGIGMLYSVAVGRYGENVRVLIGECGAVVDLVVDDQVEILLVVVLGDLLQGEVLDFRHRELRYLNDIVVSGQVSCKDRASEEGVVLSGVGDRRKRAPRNGAPRNVGR